MKVTGLREALFNRGEQNEAAARSGVLLSLEDVRASGQPAFFLDHGEHLLFLDGELYDLRAEEGAVQPGSRPLPLPHNILESGVGIEFGWRHSPACACFYCNGQKPGDSDREAVA
jgi:hypothetical protein